MRKFIKYLLIAVVAIILLVGATLAAIVIFVDPNDFKDDIAAAVHERTGRTLRLDGDLDLSVFPWLGISLGATQLSNAEGFGDTPFASVENVDIGVKLLPLLSKRIEMRTIRLQGLQLQLARAEDGRSNWDDLLPAADAKPKTEAESPRGPLALSIGGLEITDARLEWNDRQNLQRVVLEQLNLTTGPIAPSEPVDITLTTQLSAQKPVVKGGVKFSGTVTADQDTQRHRIDGMKLELNLSGESLPVKTLEATLGANLLADMPKQEIAINDLQMTALGLKLNGQIGVSQFQTAPLMQGKLNIDAFSPRELITALGRKPPQTADAAVLNRASVALEFAGTASAMTVPKLAMVLDDTSLTGSASVKGVENPAIGFDLLIDNIDADRYLPPPSETTESKPGVAAETQLPLARMRQLDVTGQIKIGSLKIFKAKASNVVLGLRAEGGQIRLHPAQAELYNGSYSGDLGLDVRTSAPQLSLNQKLTTVAIGPLLKDMLGDDKVTGTANIGTDLSASGVNLDSITRSLDGTANFSFRDGAVKGINLGQMIREAYAKLKNQPAPPKTTDQTDFAELSGSVNIIKGLVKNEDLSVKTPLLRVGGKGAVDLPQQKINYLINAAIVGTAEGQSGKELDELKSLTIPVKVTGSFSKPEFGLDLKQALQGKAKAKVDAAKQQVKQKVDTKVEQEKAAAQQKLEQKKQDTKESLQDKVKKLF